MPSTRRTPRATLEGGGRALGACSPASRASMKRSGARRRRSVRVRWAGRARRNLKRCTPRWDCMMTRRRRPARTALDRRVPHRATRAPTRRADRVWSWRVILCVGALIAAAAAGGRRGRRATFRASMSPGTRARSTGARWRRTMSRSPTSRPPKAAITSIRGSRRIGAARAKRGFIAARIISSRCASPARGRRRTSSPSCRARLARCRPRSISNTWAHAAKVRPCRT